MTIMELSFPSSFILKVFLLSLALSVATSAKPVNNNKLFSDVCRKTKDAKLCFKILTESNRTRLASSLHNLGSGTLDLAVVQAKASQHVFNLLNNRKDLPKDQVEKFKICRDDYEAAVKKLGEAKNAWTKIKYVLAERSIQTAYKVPISCQKRLVGITAPQLLSLTKVNEMSSITFEIALVVEKEMEAAKNRA